MPCKTLTDMVTKYAVTHAVVERSNKFTVCKSFPVVYEDAAYRIYALSPQKVSMNLSENSWRSPHFEIASESHSKCEFLLIFRIRDLRKPCDKPCSRCLCYSAWRAAPATPRRWLPRPPAATPVPSATLTLGSDGYSHRHSHPHSDGHPDASGAPGGFPNRPPESGRSAPYLYCQHLPVPAG